jgi:ubiquinone/menaquinone biosynthesis C-methylase UbiE
METLTAQAASQAEALTGRLFNASYEALDILMTYIGDKLGLYRSLATEGPATVADLASRTGIHPRYAREWLEQQAVTGFLDVDDPAASQGDRRYSLPRGHAESLVDPDSPFSIVPLTHFVVGTTNAIPKLLEVFRTGGGTTWDDYGPDAIPAQGNFNRPWLLSQFATEHMAQVPDVHARLLADPPARVADFGCGAGWASIALAKAFPKVTIDGFDREDEAIELARKNAAEAGVADRVSFHVADVTDSGLTGRYDLAVAIELIHDMARPVEALAAMKRVLVPGGAAILLEEKVADRFTIGEPLDRFMYGWSVLFCLPVGMTEEHSAGTGTVMRPDTLRSYAEDAGFRDVELLDIDLPLQRYYRLNP